MSSSQGVNAATVSGYPFNPSSIRDSSDWIRAIKEARIYENYKATSTDNKQTEPYWLKYGNDFRLIYANGRFKCEPDCDGNAFGSNVGDASSPPIPPPEICPSCKKGPFNGNPINLNSDIGFTPNSSHSIYSLLSPSSICIGDIFRFTYDVFSSGVMNYAINASGVFDIVVKKDEVEIVNLTNVTSQSDAITITVPEAPCVLSFKITVQSCDAEDISFEYSFTPDECINCDRVAGVYSLTMGAGQDIEPGVLTNLYDAAGLTTNCLGDTFQITYVPSITESISYSLSNPTGMSANILLNGNSNGSYSYTTSIFGSFGGIESGDVLTFTLVTLGCSPDMTMEYSNVLPPIGPPPNECPDCVDPGVPWSGSINAYPMGSPATFFPTPYTACIGDIITLSYNVAPGNPPGLDFGVTFDAVPGTALFTGTYTVNGGTPIAFAPSPVTTSGQIKIPVTDGDVLAFMIMVQSCNFTDLLTTYQYPAA